MSVNSVSPTQTRTAIVGTTSILSVRAETGRLLDGAAASPGGESVTVCWSTDIAYSNRSGMANSCGTFQLPVSLLVSGGLPSVSADPWWLLCEVAVWYAGYGKLSYRPTTRKSAKNG